MTDDEQPELDQPAHEDEASDEPSEDLEADRRATAEALLAGPGLHPLRPAPDAGTIEDTWSDEVRTALGAVRDDLRGRRLGLAISGGGALGSFEAGVLRFLYDHLAISPVAICGNSAGALNAAKLAEGDHDGRRAVDEVERVWRSLRINVDMWEAEPWLVRLQASASWASAIREQVSESSGAGNAVRAAVRVVGSLVRRPPETDGTFDALRDALRAQSLLSLTPVAELVERELDREAVVASGIALRVGTVSLEAGELRYVTETGELHDRYDQPVGQPPVDLAQGILASASIPVAFPPVPLNGEHYVDGGAREILPLELLVHRLGVERVVAISASSLGIEAAPSFEHRNLLDILRRVSAEIAPNETLRKELNPPGGWPDGVHLIVPEFDVHDSMTIDPALISISIDHGWMRASDVLAELSEDARALTAQITLARVALRELAAPLPSAFGDAAPTVPPADVPDGDVEAESLDGEPDPESREGDPRVEDLEARLRLLVGLRLDLGVPVPPSLRAWAESATPAG